MNTLLDQFSQKAAPNPGILAVDEKQGIVECFVAAIGNKDSVGDIIVPGAFTESLKKRKPRVVWGHDWNQPIGKVLDIYEVSPRDPRLPAKMRAAGVGGLYAKVQFNLHSERGREAFSFILFYGEDQEWSIGYKTIDSVFDPGKQANILKVLELFEVSPVLHGANQLTATVSIKSANTTSARRLSESPWGVFDPSFVMALRKDHPDLWSLVDDPQGEEINMLLTLPALDPDTPLSIKELTALTVRDEWAADHAQGSTLTDVLSQIKRYVVGAMGEQAMKDLIAEAIKAPIPPDAIPQERITGDVLRGYGPRRGNLERLLRYWRPIMRQPGGFRRCLVILADHPELYPLANICAWLHHETTGLWPNEGCHHPGMKNCRKKLRGWSEAEFLDRLPGGGKAFPMDDDDNESSIVTDDDVEYANRVLASFCNEEKDFIAYLGDEDNWEHVGDMDDEDNVPHAGSPRPCGCGGGCGGGKSESTEKVLEKVGRVLSGTNLAKIQQAVNLLNQVVQSTGMESTEVKSVLIEADTSDLFDVKSHIDPVLEFYGLDAEVTEEGINIKSPMSNDAFKAIETAVAGFVELKEGTKNNHG